MAEPLLGVERVSHRFGGLLAVNAASLSVPAGRITVNLAPADLPKEGGRFDLPIALGILLASGQLPEGLDVARTEFYGELGLKV